MVAVSRAFGGWGGRGGNSVFGSIVAAGGGFGAGYTNPGTGAYYAAAFGGNGGGGAYSNNGGGHGTFGYPGGAGTSSSTAWSDFLLFYCSQLLK